MQLPQNKNEWFKPSQIIYSYSYGVGIVKSIIGKKLFLEVETGIEEVHNWQEKINRKQLVPIKDAPQTLEVAYGRFIAYLHKNHLLARTLNFKEKDADYKAIPENINPTIKKALYSIGIKQLYSHQIEAWNAYQESRDIALLTETSSGKSLAFLIPALHECLQNNSVLIFFNLKGLAFDQSLKIERILQYIPASIRPKVLNINGDIPRRERLRQYVNTPTIICATPDAWNHDLAASKGNNWGLIATLLKIKLVVVDEMHLYNGSFGAHFALLNKRMQLKIEMLGGKLEDIRYIFASATIGNPNVVCQMISNRNQDNLKIINSSGAKSYGKKFVCLRNSQISTQHAAMCLSQLVELGVTTICFTVSRAQSKAIAKLAANILKKKGKNDLAASISAFYGAMKPTQRTKIINGIHSGEIKGIISTSALEAGIDISNIDAAIVCKYPGTILSARQQMGRAGRHGKGLIIFIPSHYSLIDTYYSNNPDLLFTDNAEIVSFNQSYRPILSKHIIACCSESKPTSTLLEKYFGKAAPEIVNELLEKETLIPSFNKRIDANPNLGYVHINIKMRGADGNIDYVNKNSGEEFETSSSAIAIREVYPGAIYPSQNIDGKAVKYQVDGLDLEAGKSVMSPIKESKLYTIGKNNLQINKIKTNGEEKIVRFGENNEAEIKLIPIWGLVEQTVEGYELRDKEIRWTCNNKKCPNYHQKVGSAYNKCPHCSRKLREMEIDYIVDDINYHNPISISYETAAVELVTNIHAISYFQKYVAEFKQNFQLEVKNGKNKLNREIAEVLTSEPTQLVIHTIAHQLILALPLVRHESNSKDIEFILDGNSGYFFDSAPDGTGGCETLIEYWDLVIKKAIFIVDNCDCKHGCHKCTTIHRCPERNEQLYKYLGIKALQ